MLGHSWFLRHNPQISWSSGRVLTWGAACHSYRPPQPDSEPGHPVTEDIDSSQFPSCYHDLAQVFSKSPTTILPPHRPYDLEIKLLPGSVPPRGRLYSLSPAETRAMDAYIADAIQHGFICPSTSPGAAGFFFMKKKEGGLQPCIDYRGLNKITVRDRHPLPLMTTALDVVSQSTIFTKLDLCSAYNLVRIKQGDEWKTTFITPTGHWEYLVMPIGLCNSPAVFQRLITDVLRDMLGRWVFVYLDDIMIYSRTLEEHVTHVRAVLSRLLENRLYCKLEKCAFRQETISFLGFLVSSQGFSMDPQKVQAVAHWPIPTSLKQLQSFLCFSNFHRRFIRGFSSIAAPLTALTRSSNQTRPFRLIPEATQTFHTLVHRFTTAPILVHPDPTRPFVVEVGASEVGAGAVLSQSGPDSKLHPCVYFSRKFSPTQSNYGVGDRELLAIKWALEEWQQWLLGTPDPFTIWMDHQNLIHIQNARQLNPRQARWALFFESFHFHLAYRPGSKNLKADALSRCYTQSAPVRELPPILPAQKFIAALHWPVEDTIRAALPIDPAPADAPSDRLYVPSTCRSEVLAWGHAFCLAGHQGQTRTLQFLQRALWWPSMAKDVQECVAACPTCARSETPNQPPTGDLHPLPIIHRPWSHIGLDFVTGLPPVNQLETILTIVDRFLKAVHLVALPCLPTAKQTAEILLEQVVRLNGFPQDIVSDLGPQFMSRFWKAFCRLVGASRSLSSGYHP
uniref:Gypsy retrotransposon integrase-like protein 1 n=1 Tax=Nothobranchius furzeri TaxID=105023 RepID=A0A8C6LLQ0_NOTFU